MFSGIGLCYFGVFIGDVSITLLVLLVVFVLLFLYYYYCYYYYHYYYFVACCLLLLLAVFWLFLLCLLLCVVAVLLAFVATPSYDNISTFDRGSLHVPFKGTPKVAMVSMDSTREFQLVRCVCSWLQLPLAELSLGYFSRF